MDREAILSLGKAYQQCQYQLTEEQQAEVDLINEKINALGPAAAVGAGVWDYHDLRKQGYTHAEAILKAVTGGLGAGLGGLGGGALGSVAGPVGTFAGGVGGGMAGYEGGNRLYDKLTGRVRGEVTDKDGNKTTTAKVPGQTATLNGKPVVWGKNGGWEPVGGEETETTTTTDTEQTPTQTDTQSTTTQTTQQPKPETKPETKPGGNLTPMQQWAKKFPKLAAKVKPGQVGYDAIQKMSKPQQSQPQSSVTGVKNATKNMVQNTQKLNQGSKNMKTDIKTPISRAASKVASASKNYSDKMNNANVNTKKQFATIPEQFEHELLEYMVEHDIEFVTGRDCYLDEGIGKLLQKLGRKALPAVKAGFKRVKEGGKWVLKKVKGKGDDAADKVKDAVKPPKTKPSKSGLTDSKGDPLQVPVKAKPPKVKPPTAKSKPEVKPTPKTTPKTASKPGSGDAIKNTAKAATVAGVGALAGNELYKVFNKDNDKGGGGGGSTSKPESTTSKPTSGPGGSGNAKPGSASGKPGGTKKPSSDRLATALKGTQDAITSERKAKEGKNYSGPSTIKNPGKYQSKIGTDFSDVKTEEAILSSMMDDLLEMDAAAWNKALEKAAAATQKKHKEQGMKIHATDGVKELFRIKKGKV